MYRVVFFFLVVILWSQRGAPWWVEEEGRRRRSGGGRGEVRQGRSSFSQQEEDFWRSSQDSFFFCLFLVESPRRGRRVPVPDWYQGYLVRQVRRKGGVKGYKKKKKRRKWRRGEDNQVMRSSPSFLEEEEMYGVRLHAECSGFLYFHQHVAQVTKIKDGRQVLSSFKQQPNRKQRLTLL